MMDIRAVRREPRYLDGYAGLATVVSITRLHGTNYWDNLLGLHHQDARARGCTS